MLAIDNYCNIRHHCHHQHQQRHLLDELQYQSEHLNGVDWTWMNLVPRLLVLLAWNRVLWLIKLMSRGPYHGPYGLYFGCLLGIYGFTFWADWNLNIIHFRHALAWSHNQVRLANQNQDFSCTGNSHVSLPFLLFDQHMLRCMLRRVTSFVTTVVTMF